MSDGDAAGRAVAAGREGSPREERLRGEQGNGERNGEHDCTSSRVGEGRKGERRGCRVEWKGEYWASWAVFRASEL